MTQWRLVTACEKQQQLKQENSSSLSYSSGSRNGGWVAICLLACISSATLLLTAVVLTVVRASDAQSGSREPLTHGFKETGICRRGAGLEVIESSHSRATALPLTASAQAVAPFSASSVERSRHILAHMKYKILHSCPISDERSLAGDAT